MSLYNRIIVLVLLICFALSSVCFAKVETYKDSFDGASSIYSTYKHTQGNIFAANEYQYILLKKYKPATKEMILQLKAEVRLVGKASQTLYLPSHDGTADIKIDDNIFPLVLLDSRISDMSSNFPYLTGWYDFPDSLTPLIANAKKVTLRYRWGVPDGNLETVIFEVPPKILKEWQEVLTKNLP